MQTNIKYFKRETNVEQYINLLINLIDNKEIPYNRIKLEGLLKIHALSCHKNPDKCNCFNLVQEFNEKDEEVLVKNKKWWLFVKYLMFDSMERFPKSSKLHLLMGYIMHEKLKNKFKSLYELMITDETKPNLQEEYSLFRYKNIIEEEMIEQDLLNNESKGVDVNIIVNFENKLVVFLSIIEKAVSLHLEFWRELLEDNPDIQKLQTLGSKITSIVENTSDLFKKLNEMNPNHIRCLEIYGYFMKEIVNDDQQGNGFIEKAEYLGKSSVANKQFLENDRQKYGENTNTCICTVSGNFNNIGMVMNCNNEITKVLGYSKADIIGQNVNRLQPKIYADVHDNLIRGYLDKSEGKVIGLERLVFPQKKSGYVIPATLMVKVLPNLEEGIQLVGFMKELEGLINISPDGNMDNVGENTFFLMFVQETGLLLGITYNCTHFFGIPASLVYGNSSNTNEFTVDAICQDLLCPEKIEEMKSQNGLISYIDTTMIPQNFLLGEEESDHFQKNQKSKFQNEELDPDQDLFEKNKNNKFRKVKVIIFFQEEQTLNETRISIIKFQHLPDSDEDLKNEMDNQEYAQANEINNAQEEQQLDKSDIEKKQEEHEYEKNYDDIEKSEQNSNISANSQDDMRNLKEFKALITEKNEPKSIKILKRSVWVLCLILIVMDSLNLGFQFNQNSNSKEGVNSVAEAYQRHSIMADINFYVRQLDFLSKGLFNIVSGTVSSNEQILKNKFSGMNDNLQQVQYTVMNNRLLMEGRQGSQNALIYFNIEFLLSDKQIQVFSSIYNDAVFQYITAVSSLANATLAEFQISTIENTQKSFFIVVRNGLNQLRIGSEIFALRFYNFYHNLTDKHLQIFQILMIVSVCVIVLSLFVLIPVVFQVYKTNNKVLSLFGIIPLFEIKELAGKCEAFIQNFLSDEHEKDLNVSEQVEEENKNPVEKNQDHPQQINEEIETNGNQNHNSYMEINNESQAADVGNVKLEISQMIEQQKNNLNKSGQEVLRKSQLQEKSPLKIADKNPNKMETDQNQKKEEEKNDEEIENIRTQKLMNSKDNNKNIIIIQFSFFASLFIVYFLMHYIQMNSFLNGVRKSYTHLKLVNDRSNLIKYTIVFTFQDLSLDTLYHSNLKNQRENFTQQVYENEDSINFRAVKDISSTYDSYVAKAESISYFDMCKNFYGNNITALSICNQVGQELLKKGLATSIISLVETIRSLTTDFENSKKTTADQKNSIAKAQIIIDLKDQMIPAIDYLANLFKTSFYDFLDWELNFVRIKFSIFIVMLFGGYVFIWAKYLKNLNIKIWRTKGMLNLIPMEIINKHENLKQAFISGDILQAVK